MSVLLLLASVGLVVLALVAMLRPWPHLNKAPGRRDTVILWSGGAGLMLFVVVALANGGWAPGQAAPKPALEHAGSAPPPAAAAAPALPPPEMAEAESVFQSYVIDSGACARSWKAAQVEAAKLSEDTTVYDAYDATIEAERNCRSTAKMLTGVAARTWLSPKVKAAFAPRLIACAEGYEHGADVMRRLLGILKGDLAPETVHAYRMAYKAAASEMTACTSQLRDEVKGFGAPSNDGPDFEV